jgi:2-polyprenyl-6-methoxyphenol hydroxylase-like FAD-dependent oxidoreductase
MPASAPTDHAGEVLIAGAGIGGLALALALHRRGVACRLFEAVDQLKPIGVGINLLPHATAALAELEVLPALERLAIATREAAYFNRFGQLIHTEPLGRFAGYATPQLSIHRGALQLALLAAVRARLGAEEADGDTRRVLDEADAAMAGDHAGGAALIGCDGIHSAVRRTLYPDEGEPVHSGVNMWRGTTRMRPVLSGASMVRAGWLAQGKLVAYPIQAHDDGTQTMNWVAEIATETQAANDWNRPGRLADFLPAFADWRFDWLDVPAMLTAADQILEYPMVDRDPLPRWSVGRVTLLGDAAHPMYPRGSNGAGQAVLDALVLADALARRGADPAAALAEYEAERLPRTSAVVCASRSEPPDAIIREVWRRTGDQPFARIEDVIPRAELAALIDRYKAVAGYQLPSASSA